MASAASPATAAAAAAAAPSSTYDVLIVGGGPAGLAVASHCAAVGRSYLILEARARLGGRVLTNVDLGCPVDVGASWIHHYGTSNPIAREAWNHRVLMGVPRGGQELWLPRGDNSADCVQSQDVLKGAQAFGIMEAKRAELKEAHCASTHRHSAFCHVEYAEYLGGMEYTPAETIALMDCDARAGSKQCVEGDQTYAEFLKQFPVVQAARSSSAAADSASSAPPATTEPSAESLSPMAAGVLRSYLREESLYEGCSLERLSAAHCGEQLEGIPECDMQCGSGYGKLLGLIAKKAKIDQHAVLDTVVTAVETRMDGVTVHARKLEPHERPITAHGSSIHPVESPVPPPSSASSGSAVVYHGKYVVVTVPLGVLQRRSIQFTPPLPKWKDHAIDAMGYGLLNKVVLQFDTPFWEEQPQTNAQEQGHEAAVRSDSAVAAGGKVNVINILQSPEDPPLWIVNLSRPLHAAAARVQHGVASANGVVLNDATYSRTAAEYRPLALTFQEEEEEYIAGNVPEDDDDDDDSSKGKTVPAAAAAPVVAAAAKAGAATASSSVSSSVSPAVATPPAPMHVLVSFTSNFDESVPATEGADAPLPWTASRTEAQSDSAIVGQLMRQLRRAFQGGVETAVSQAELDAQSRQIHVSATSTESSVAYAHPHPSVPGSVSSTPLPVPVAFRFTAPQFAVTPRPVRAVPEPVGYIVTRWGLEPFSHGAYAHYRAGSGPHTAALLGKAVAVRAVATAAAATTAAPHVVSLECVEDEDDCAAAAAGASHASATGPRWSDIHSDPPHASVSAPRATAVSAAFASASRRPQSTRLLFAGEATLGVHLGCADSAWLSGLREAKRIQLLWAQQDKRSK